MRKSLLTLLQRTAFTRPGLGFMSAKAYRLRDRLKAVSDLATLHRHPHQAARGRSRLRGAAEGCEGPLKAAGARSPAPVRRALCRIRPASGRAGCCRGLRSPPCAGVLQRCAGGKAAV